MDSGRVASVAIRGSSGSLSSWRRPPTRWWASCHPASTFRETRASGSTDISWPIRAATPAGWTWWDVWPGVGIEAARADFAGISGRLEEQYPGTNRAYTTTLIPFHEAVVGETRAPLLILLGATGLLLLIACANVTNLLLARMADRGREIAVRTAMGAGRVRLSRQMLT